MGRKGMYRIQLRPAFPPIKRSDKEVTCDCYFSRSVLEGGRTNCSTCVGTSVISFYRSCVAGSTSTTSDERT